MDATTNIDDIPISDGSLAVLKSEAQRRGQTFNAYLLDVLHSAAESIRTSQSS